MERHCYQMIFIVELPPEDVIYQITTQVGRVDSTETQGLIDCAYWNELLVYGTKSTRINFLHL